MPLPRLRFAMRIPRGETVRSRPTGHPDCCISWCATAVCSPAFRGAGCQPAAGVRYCAIERSVCLPREAGFGGGRSRRWASAGRMAFASSPAPARQRVSLGSWFGPFRFPSRSLFDSHCEHCRARLPPFGTVGNGRFCPVGSRLFIAILAKQCAIPLPRAVRARQFFLAAAACAVTAERSEEASSPALRPRFFAALRMTGLARIPCRDQLLYPSRLRMVRFRDVLTLARSASEERCCASLARASG